MDSVTREEFVQRTAGRGGMSEEERLQLFDKAHALLFEAYIHANAADALCRRSEGLLEKLRLVFNMSPKQQLGFILKDVRGAIGKMNKLSEEVIDPEVTEVFVPNPNHSPNERNQCPYDIMRNNAFEYLRYCMLLIDRTVGDEEAMRQVNSYLLSLPSKGVWSLEDIQSFKIRNE